MAKRAPITGLERFGLTRSTLTALGSRKVQVTVSLDAYDVTPGVVRRPAGDRHGYLRQRARRWVARLGSRLPGLRMTVEEGGYGIPHRLSIQLPAHMVRDLAAQAGVAVVSVVRIAGRRKQRDPKPPLDWFCVKGRVAIQVEDERGGMQLVEDRFVLVRAASFDDAERRLRHYWGAEARPYLNPHGQIVRWQLEEIEDVYDLGETDLDPTGVEVYSRIGRRRMREQYVWRSRRPRHPLTPTLSPK